MAKPVLLDLFCGAGGAGMGYHRAGFRVIGVDRDPQPRYPFEFKRGNALFPPFPIHMADVIHASPPCQAYTAANNIHGRTHLDLIGPVREMLIASDKPYLIENVPGAPLLDPVLICGRALKLGVKRHRYFESNLPLIGTICPRDHPGNWVSVFGHATLTRGEVVGRTKGGGPHIHRTHLPVHIGQRAMGIDWMGQRDLSEAIPPAYTEFLGRQVIAAIQYQTA